MSKETEKPAYLQALQNKTFKVKKEKNKEESGISQPATLDANNIKPSSDFCIDEPATFEIKPIFYDADNHNIELYCDSETIWASQSAIAKMFNKAKSTINEHLCNLIEEGEIEESTSIKKFGNSEFAKKPTNFYNLDAIIPVGYRVNSQKATAFRKWATSVLKEYITKGYVINENLLKQRPEKLKELASQIRKLRAEEKNVYASVRECFKVASLDYEKSSKEVKRFYALLQDKFHFAITGMERSKLILDRADHREPNMGISSMEGALPTKRERETGKNYLKEDELYKLHLLSEQFLLFAESTMLRDKRKTMSELCDFLDNLIVFNEYPVFDGHKDIRLKERANEHAQQEYESFLEIKKLELLGIDVDLESYYCGEYEEHREELNAISETKVRKILKEKMQKLLETSRKDNIVLSST